MSKFTRTANRLKREPKVKSIRLSGKSHLIIHFVDGTTNSLGKKMAGLPYNQICRVLSVT
jgi:hypothetical protein